MAFLIEIDGLISTSLVLKLNTTLCEGKLLKRTSEIQLKIFQS